MARSKGAHAIDLLPPIGAGPAQIGASCLEVEAALSALDGFMPPHPVRPRGGGLLTFASGLAIALHANGAGNVVAIEFYKPDDNTDEVRFQGVDVFATPADDVIGFLESRIRIQGRRRAHHSRARIADVAVASNIARVSRRRRRALFEAVFIARAGYLAPETRPVGRLADDTARE